MQEGMIFHKGVKRKFSEPNHNIPHNCRQTKMLISSEGRKSSRETPAELAIDPGID